MRIVGGAIRRILPRAALVFVLASFTGLAYADNFSFTGTFATDDQVQLFNFTLTDGETPTFQTWGYGGGENAANATIQPGGFESLLTWFGPDGSVIGNSAPYGCGSGNIYLFDCLDAFANPGLPAGTYTLALTVYENASLGTGNPGDPGLGFQYDGQPNFTAIGQCAMFCDSQENQDNGNWAVDIRGVDSAELAGGVDSGGSASAPEPVTMLLAGCGLACVALVQRSRAAARMENSTGDRL